MEKLTLGGVGAFITIAWWKIKSFWDFWGPVIEDIVQEVENKAKDGTIDKADRKAIATKAIDLVAQRKGKKIDFLERIFISWLIDKIAGKLPDFNLDTTATVNRAIIETKENK